ncbi:hypothetical protein CR513_37564, partial [Mucuna pruriens]
MNFIQFIDASYLIKNIINAYFGQWLPIGNDSMIHGKGHPKATRIRNEMNWRESQSRKKIWLLKV